MKSLQLVLFVLAIMSIKSLTECPTGFEPEENVNLDTCNGLTLTGEFKKCCLVTYEFQGLGSDTTCFALLEDVITNRNVAVERFKSASTSDSCSIKCVGDSNASSFLKLGLLTILFILL